MNWFPPIAWPERDKASRAVRDYLSALDRENAEAPAGVDMVARVARLFGLKPKRLAGDTAYGNAPTLKSLVERGIEPHIQIWDKSQRHDGTFSRGDFAYDREPDRYTRPGGSLKRVCDKVHSPCICLGRGRPRPSR